MGRHLQDWLTGYLEYTDNTEPPLMYRTWVGISTIAAAMERKCWIELGFLRFYPNMYVVLVGPSGKCRKGVAMTPGLLLLENLGLGSRVVADSITTAQLIVRLAAVSRHEVDKKTGLVTVHSSMTVFSKELAVFLGDYNEEFIMTLVDWYDCKDNWKRETKGSGSFSIDGVWLNLIGATTPKLLREKMNTAALGGGLTSRMIFITEFDRDKNISCPILSPKEIKLGEALLNDLTQIHQLQGQFTLTEGFIKLYDDWYTAVRNNPPFNDERFDDYFERRPNHIIKLAMILNASRTDSMLVDESDLARAIAVLEATEKKMRYTFSGVGKNEQAEVIDRVIRILVMRKKIGRRELCRMLYHDASVAQIDDVIKTLEITGHAQVVYGQKDTIITLLGDANADQ